MSKPFLFEHIYIELNFFSSASGRNGRLMAYAGNGAAKHKDSVFFWGAAVLLCSHFVSVYHHQGVVGAFHLAQAGVAKVLFPIGVCEVGMLCKHIVYKQAVDCFACAAIACPALAVKWVHLSSATYYALMDVTLVVKRLLRLLVL